MRGGGHCRQQGERAEERLRGTDHRRHGEDGAPRRDHRAQRRGTGTSGRARALRGAGRVDPARLEDDDDSEQRRHRSRHGPHDAAIGRTADGRGRVAGREGRGFDRGLHVLELRHGTEVERRRIHDDAPQYGFAFCHVRLDDLELVLVGNPAERPEEHAVAVLGHW